VIEANDVTSPRCTPRSSLSSGGIVVGAAALGLRGTLLRAQIGLQSPVPQWW
jgi:hypothetical protein